MPRLQRFSFGEGISASQSSSLASSSRPAPPPHRGFCPDVIESRINRRLLRSLPDGFGTTPLPPYPLSCEITRLEKHLPVTWNRNPQHGPMDQSSSTAMWCGVTCHLFSALNLTGKGTPRHLLDPPADPSLVGATRTTVGSILWPVVFPKRPLGKDGDGISAADTGKRGGQRGRFIFLQWSEKLSQANRKVCSFGGQSVQAPRAGEKRRGGVRVNDG